MDYEKDFEEWNREHPSNSYPLYVDPEQHAKEAYLAAAKRYGLPSEDHVKGYLVSALLCDNVSLAILDFYRWLKEREGK